MRDAMAVVKGGDEGRGEGRGGSSRGGRRGDESRGGIGKEDVGDARVPHKRNPTQTHVVGARSRVVSEPDGEVLHLQGLLLVDLFPIVNQTSKHSRLCDPQSVAVANRTHDVEGDDLSVGLLDLLELTEVVPESGLGDDVVGSEDAHAAGEGSANPRTRRIDHDHTQRTRASAPARPRWGACGPRRSTR
jgi:hypothetical protein